MADALSTAFLVGGPALAGSLLRGAAGHDGAARPRRPAARDRGPRAAGRCRGRARGGRSAGRGARRGPAARGVLSAAPDQPRIPCPPTPVTALGNVVVTWSAMSSTTRRLKSKRWRPRSSVCCSGNRWGGARTLAADLSKHVGMSLGKVRAIPRTTFFLSVSRGGLTARHPPMQGRRAIDYCFDADDEDAPRHDEDPRGDDADDARDDCREKGIALQSAQPVEAALESSEDPENERTSRRERHEAALRGSPHPLPPADRSHRGGVWRY